MSTGPAGRFLSRCTNRSSRAIHRDRKTRLIGIVEKGTCFSGWQGDSGESLVFPIPAYRAKLQSAYVTGYVRLNPQKRGYESPS